MTRSTLRSFAFAASTALAAMVTVRSPVAAQVPDTSVRLSVGLDRLDWKYRVGDSARFLVALTRNGRPLTGVPVRVELGPERMPVMRTDTVTIGSGAQVLTASRGRPGFIRATARAVVEGVTYTELATAAFEPERLTPTTTMPADFEDFWRRAVADARKVPLAPQMTRMPERSTPEVDVYHVSFRNHRATSRLYGMLSVPTKPGRYPAMLVVPGAGVRPYFPGVGTARQGVIHLTIGIHGIPVDRDSLFYNELRATALDRYFTFGVEDRDLYYYKRVFVGVVRAGDFLLGLPQWDGVNYVVQGGSQGGGLAIISAVLDPRVKAIAASYPAMADQFGYFSGHAGGWPHMLQDTTGMRALPEKLETLRYYDVINFARLLRVPGIYAWGYNDNIVPPTSSYATYNTITAPKRALIVPDAEHERTPEQVRLMDQWLLAALGVAPERQP